MPQIPNRNFYVFNHQDKAKLYVEALIQHGWCPVKYIRNANFILSDADVYRRNRLLKECKRKGKTVFLYPHSAIPNLFWDFPGVTYSNAVTAQFVVSEGHTEIMRSYGNPYTTHAVGWHLCPQGTFQPRQLESILFAPIHPNSNGFLCKLDTDINAETYRRLLEVSRAGNIRLDVRYLQDLKANGLWNEPGVNFIEGKADQSYNEIDRASVVVGHHTFAFMSVARRIPTAMMGEKHAVRMGGKESELLTALSWEKYKDLLMYPLDILECDDPRSLLERACATDVDIHDWRRRLIGDQFDGAKFIAAVESYF